MWCRTSSARQRSPWFRGLQSRLEKNNYSIKFISWEDVNSEMQNSLAFMPLGCGGRSKKPVQNRRHWTVRSKRHRGEAGGQRRCWRNREWCRGVRLSTPKQHLYLLFTGFPGSAEKTLENSPSVNQVTDALKAITRSLLAMVSDRYTLINFIRMTLKGLLTFQWCCSDVCKSTWNDHQKESAQHRTNRCLWSICCGPGI